MTDSLSKWGVLCKTESLPRLTEHHVVTEREGEMDRETEVGIRALLILCIKYVTNEDQAYSSDSSTQCSALWGPKQEGNPRKRRYVCTCSRFTLLYSRNQHFIVKQLYLSV